MDGLGPEVEVAMVALGAPRALVAVEQTFALGDMVLGAAAGVVRARLGAGSGETVEDTMSDGAPGMPTRLRQSTHLHCSVHGMEAWKHSQYFLRQPDFLQWQPLLCRIASASPACLIFGRKACGSQRRRVSRDRGGWLGVSCEAGL